MDEEDSDLIVSQNQTHSIGANGNHDLARSVLQVCIDLVPGGFSNCGFKGDLVMLLFGLSFSYY